MAKSSKPTWKHRGDQVIYETSTGAVVQCLPVATLLQMVEQQIPRPEEPQPPTMTIEGAGGATEERPITAEFVERHPDRLTEEQAGLWAAYEANRFLYDLALSERAGKVGTAQMRVMAIRGVKILDGPDEAQWVKEQEFMGFYVPEDPLERRLHFFQTEIVNTADDARYISLGIAKASGASEEAIQQMEDSFRSALGRSEGEDASGDSGADEGEPAVVQVASPG